MTADVIPVNMGCHGSDRFIGQLHHLVVNIADAQAGVDQQAAGNTAQKIGMRFLPIPVLTDDMCIPVYMIVNQSLIQCAPSGLPLNKFSKHSYDFRR